MGVNVSYLQFEGHAMQSQLPACADCAVMVREYPSDKVVISGSHWHAHFCLCIFAGVVIRSSIFIPYCCAKHKMWPIVTDDLWSVLVSMCVCVLVTIMSCVQMAKPVEMLFGMWTWVNQRTMY